MFDRSQSGSGYFGKEISLVTFIPDGNRTLDHTGVTLGVGGSEGQMPQYFFYIRIVFLAQLNCGKLNKIWGEFRGKVVCVCVLKNGSNQSSPSF